MLIKLLFFPFFLKNAKSERTILEQQAIDLLKLKRIQTNEMSNPVLNSIEKIRSLKL